MAKKLRITSLAGFFAGALLCALLSGAGGAAAADDDSGHKEKVISVMKFEDRSIGTKDFQPWTMGIPDMIMQSLGSIPHRILLLMCKELILL